MDIVTISNPTYLHDWLGFNFIGRSDDVQERNQGRELHLPWRSIHVCMHEMRAHNDHPLLSNYHELLVQVLICLFVLRSASFPMVHATMVMYYTDFGMA